MDLPDPRPIPTKEEEAEYRKQAGLKAAQRLQARRANAGNPLLPNRNQQRRAQPARTAQQHQRTAPTNQEPLQTDTKAEQQPAASTNREQPPRETRTEAEPNQAMSAEDDAQKSGNGFVGSGLALPPRGLALPPGPRRAAANAKPEEQITGAQTEQQKNVENIAILNKKNKDLQDQVGAYYEELVKKDAENQRQAIRIKELAGENGKQKKLISTLEYAEQNRDNAARVQETKTYAQLEQEYGDHIRKLESGAKAAEVDLKFYKEANENLREKHATEQEQHKNAVDRLSHAETVLTMVQNGQVLNSDNCPEWLKLLHAECVNLRAACDEYELAANENAAVLEAHTDSFGPKETMRKMMPLKQRRRKNLDSDQLNVELERQDSRSSGRSQIEEAGKNLLDEMEGADAISNDGSKVDEKEEEDQDKTLTDQDINGQAQKGASQEQTLTFSPITSVTTSPAAPPQQKFVSYSQKLFDKTRKELVESRAKVKQLQKDNKVLQDTVDKSSEDNKNTKEAIDGLNESKVQMLGQLKQFHEENNDLKATVDRLVKSENEYRVENDLLRGSSAEVRSLNQQLEWKEAEKTRELKRQKDTLTKDNDGKLATMQKKLDKYEKRYDGLPKILEDLTPEQLRPRLEKFQAEVRSLHNASAANSETYKKQNKEIESLKEEIAEKDTIETKRLEESLAKAMDVAEKCIGTNDFPEQAATTAPAPPIAPAPAPPPAAPAQPALPVPMVVAGTQDVTRAQIGGAVAWYYLIPCFILIPMLLWFLNEAYLMRQLWLNANDMTLDALYTIEQHGIYDMNSIFKLFMQPTNWLQSVFELQTVMPG